MNYAEYQAVLQSAAGPLCDDCIYPRLGYASRQAAYQAGTKLKSRGLLSRSSGVCSSCGKRKTVNAPSGQTAEVEQLVAKVTTQMDRLTPWHWEGNVQDAIVAYLAAAGYQMMQVVNTATKETGVDVIARLDGHELWVTVKGYPNGTAKTNAGTQSRHWFSHAMFDVVRYRTKRPDIQIAVGLPDGFTSYLNLAPSVDWLRSSAPFHFIWVTEDGSVREE
jgi:hypothetical protein